MARPLTKRDAEGNLYTRLEKVENQIDETVGLALCTLKERLRVADRKEPGYLSSECLVHLVRRARHDDDQQRISCVLPVLLGRCEANLLVKIPDGRLPDAGSIREEVLGKFSELFASDGSGDRPDELDFYECRFNLAFRAFRVDVVRGEEARQEYVARMPEPRDDEPPDAYEDVFARITEAFQSPATQDSRYLWEQLIEAIKELPANERDAVILVHIMGYKEESMDPEEETAATRCNCEGRTIRNRLTRAAAKLSRFKEDL